MGMFSAFQFKLFFACANGSVTEIQRNVHKKIVFVNALINISVLLIRTVKLLLTINVCRASVRKMT